jgi:hypothetical protein
VTLPGQSRQRRCLPPRALAVIVMPFAVNEVLNSFMPYFITIGLKMIFNHGIGTIFCSLLRIFAAADFF